MGKLRPLKLNINEKVYQAPGILLPRNVRRQLAIEESERQMLTWLEELTKLLSMHKIEWKLEEDETGIAVKNNTTSQWLVFNAVEGQAIPPFIVLEHIHMWITGHLTPDNLYRLLTPQEQIRLSNRVGLKPLADAQDPQKSLDNALKQREDLRKQGLDPQKEGLV